MGFISRWPPEPPEPDPARSGTAAERGARKGLDSPGRLPTAAAPDERDIDLSQVWGWKKKNIAFRLTHEGNKHPGGSCSQRRSFTCGGAGSSTTGSSGRWGAQRLDVMDWKPRCRQWRGRLNLQELYKHLREGLKQRVYKDTSGGKFFFTL